MLEKITGIMREYVFVLSIVITIIGLILLSMGIIHYGFEDAGIEFIETLEEWNAYVLVLGLIVLGLGLWYLYSFFKNKKFILKEIKTNKRSEFLKKHNELKSVVKHMPSKYQTMLKEKESELKIK